MGKAKDFITTHKTAVIIAAVTIVVIIGLAVGIPCGIFFAPKHGKVLIRMTKLPILIWQKMDM